MAGRFSNLEFDEREEREEQSATEQVKDQRYYKDLAHERYWVGDFEQALRFYSRALEFDRRQADAWRGQILALIELDETHEARVWSDKALELFGSDPELLSAKAIAVTRQGDIAQGLALTDAAVAEKGTSALRWRARGEAMIARDPKNAQYCFDKAVAEDPGDWRTPLAIGRACLFHCQYAMAAGYAQRATDQQPGSAWAWANLGVTYEMLHQADKARHAYETALTHDRAQQLAGNRLGAMNAGGVFGVARRLWNRMWTR